MKIGLLQLNSTVGDFAANRKNCWPPTKKAVALGAEFVLAPEMFLCGYPPRDLLLRADLSRPISPRSLKPQKVPARPAVRRLR
jgi:predicted amidohydrolase